MRVTSSLALAAKADSFLAAPKRNLTDFCFVFNKCIYSLYTNLNSLSVNSSVCLKTKMEGKLERVENDCLSAYLEVSSASGGKKGRT